MENNKYTNMQQQLDKMKSDIDHIGLNCDLLYSSVKHIENQLSDMIDYVNVTKSTNTHPELQPAFDKIKAASKDGLQFVEPHQQIIEIMRKGLFDVEQNRDKIHLRMNDKTMAQQHCKELNKDIKAFIINSETVSSLVSRIEVKLYHVIDTINVRTLDNNLELEPQLRECKALAQKAIQEVSAYRDAMNVIMLKALPSIEWTVAKIETHIENSLENNIRRENAISAKDMIDVPQFIKNMLEAEEKEIKGMSPPSSELIQSLKEVPGIQNVETMRQPNGYSVCARCENGYDIDIAKNTFTYGHEEDLWEIAIMKDNIIVYDTPITDDVLGYLSDQDVIKYCNDIAKLEPAPEQKKDTIARNDDFGR